MTQVAGCRKFDMCISVQALIAVLFVGLVGCDSIVGSKPPFDLSEAKYVGESSCIECHREQAELYSGSHHDLAMQLATDATVLGDFNDVRFVHHDVESRLYRDGDRFMIQTEGPDGELHDYHVKYVFGLEPLQQYMVEFPSEAGSTGHTDGSGATNSSIIPTPALDNSDGLVSTLPRVQVLRISWDTEKKEWFYLAPPDVEEKLDPSDDLHWTGIAQRWNTMCAECHSTDLKKSFEPGGLNFVASKNGDVNGKFSNPHAPPIGHYDSTFIDIDVSCESCHGPGSVHVELAKQWMPGWNRERGYGLANLKAAPENQIQSCAPCHSRRSVLAADYQAGDDLYDYYTNSLLVENVYYPDGQILDEDYVHGSFIQSKMYHKGIQCSDCHDPHSVKLKHNGNEVCTSCHQHPAAKYDTVAHHFHKPGTEGAACVNCHMPTTTYMEVDERRDHSLRIPRPDLSLKIGTPNACTGCHLEEKNVPEEQRIGLDLYQDWMAAARDGNEAVAAELERANKWCDEACDKWYGADRRRDEHFGLAIAAGQNRDPDAVQQLQSLLRKKGFEAPALARATALQVLREVDPEAAAEDAARLIDDEHPLVRGSSASALLGGSDVTKNIRLLETVLSDSSRSVRIEAARTLLELPPSLWNSSAAGAMRRAIDELEESLGYNNDRAGAHMTLGILAEQQGKNQQAIRHYETAIVVEPTVTGPRTNLAALLERNMATQAQSSAPEENPIRREINRLRDEELPLLERDARLMPTSAPIHYRLGLALYLRDRKEEAIEHLVSAAELEPEQAEFAQATAMLFESLEKWDQAEQWGEKALQRSGNSQQAKLLLDRIRSSKKSAGK